VALNYKNFNDISAKELTFTDNFFKLKKNYVSSSIFEYNGYDILKNVYDAKTNNFSNLILTKKQKNSEVLDVKSPSNNENDIDIITTLSFFGKGDNNGAFLCFNKSYDTWDMDVSSADFCVTKGKPNYYQNYLFRLETYDKLSYCQISHNFGDATYYLEYNKDTFQYTDKKNSETTKFLYHISGNFLRLYIKTLDGIKKIKCVNNNGTYKLELGAYRSSDDDNTADNIFINNEGSNSNTFVDENGNYSYFVDNSWVTYDRKNKIDVIDNDYSTFSLDSQFLLHHEYCADNDINIIPLKNNLTYQGSLVNGANNTHSNDGYYIKSPLVDFKTYTGINSGINQEYGNDNIILTFNFTDQEYHIEPGEEYIFSISTSDSSSLGPLYPYNTINVNDTSFVRNGAFGSSTPYMADKFKKLQNENTKYNTGLYLCTWLYQPSPEATPVWLDRYYYPDMIQRKTALTADIFSPSFNNIPDNGYEFSGDKFFVEDVENFKLALQNNTYADKKSDLTIEPGTSYKYKRVGKEEVETIFEELEPSRISTVKDQNGNNVNLDAAFAFNKENWRSISSESFENTSAINFNTNLYINPYKKMGIQIFGSDYNTGVNIQNRKDLAPFHYYASASSVHMMNNNYQIRQSCNIFEKYNTNIQRLIIGSPFDDLYILTDDSVIIMEYDLKLKSRILYKDIENLYSLIGIIEEGTPGKVLSKYQSLEYNTNLYIPINRKDDKYIIKIILRPEKEGEKTLTARRLRNDEFVNNFTNTYDESLVETEAIIKSLYIDKEGILYAFNYDKLKMSFDGDTIYGLYNTSSEDKNNEKANHNWYYIFNQSIGRLYSSAAASKYAEFSSDVSIDDIAMNPLGEMALVRGFRKNATSGIINEREKRLEIYNRTKTKIYNYPLQGFTSIAALDYYTYIDSAFEEQMVFSVIGVKLKQIVIIEYQSYNQKVRVHYTGIDADFIENFYQATNSNALINTHDENKLYFNMFLPMGIYNKKLSIEWDLKEAQEGWYNINVEADTDKAIFRIRINDEIFGEITYKDDEDFYRFGHNNDSIFDAMYYFGAIGKDHGTRLHEILSDDLYDPYSLQNTKTENTTLYTKALKYHEYQAMRLKYGNINPLTITLPCGIRNGVEEIVRYFKYRTPGFITNKVKINISGLDEIKYESEMNALKKEIYNALKENGDCLTKINEIEFI
jgi:hypothetical protein